MVREPGEGRTGLEWVVSEDPPAFAAEATSFETGAQEHRMPVDQVEDTFALHGEDRPFGAGPQVVVAVR